MDSARGVRQMDREERIARPAPVSRPGRVHSQNAPVEAKNADRRVGPKPELLDEIKQAAGMNRNAHDAPERPSASTMRRATRITAAPSIRPVNGSLTASSSASACLSA